MNDEKAKRYSSATGGPKPARHYVGDGDISSHDIAWLYERLTGKKADPDAFNAVSAKLRAAKEKAAGTT